MRNNLIKEIIKDCIHNGKINWRNHALKRMLERNIPRNDVIRTLLTGEQIKDYPDDLPFPSYLYFNNDTNNPLHVLFSINDEEIWIITAYNPDLDQWEKDYRTRKRR